MSNFGPMGAQRQVGVPTPPKGEPIARYDTYLEAQRAVDFLSDNQFPVQFVTIVGSGLRMVERVTGRLTYGRVAFAGGASGAWFGLFVGILLSLFGNSVAMETVVASMAIGAAFGILFGVISFAFTGGRRDFTSTSQIVASEYEVLCMPEQAGNARTLLQRLPGGAGRGTSASAWPGPSGPTGGPSSGGPFGGASGPGSWPGQPPAGTPYGPQSPVPPGYGPPIGTPYSPQPGREPVTAPEAPAERSEPPTGPTYSEMIEKQRREREERERAEREGGTPGSGT